MTTWVTRRSVRLRAGAVSVTQRWALLAVVVVLWELATRAAEDPFFPPPTQIARTGAELWFTGPAAQLFLTDTVYENMLYSVGVMLGGWLLAAVLGIAAGLLLGRSRTALAYTGGLISFFRAIPPPLLVPMFMVTVGLDLMPFATIVFGAMWPIVLNTIDGARSVDPTKVDTVRAFRLSRAQWMLGVVLPTALPKVFAGLRLSLSLALILMVVSELNGAARGFGKAMEDAQRDYDLPAMWAWMVLLAILGYVFNTVLLTFERRALRWQQQTTVGG